jgi:hypothetical protein
MMNQHHKSRNMVHVEMGRKAAQLIPRVGVPPLHTQGPTTLYTLSPWAPITNNSLTVQNHFPLVSNFQDHLGSWSC